MRMFQVLAVNYLHLFSNVPEDCWVDSFLKAADVRKNQICS